MRRTRQTLTPHNKGKAWVNKKSVLLRDRVSRSGIPALALAALVLAPTVVSAKPGHRNLGGGLEQLASPASASRSLAPGQVAGGGDAAGTLELIRPMIKDAAGSPLVLITLSGKVPAASVLKTLQDMAGVTVTATDLKYRAGVIEAYVPASALAAVAGNSGVLAVVPSSPMETNVGAVDSQGIVQHRVDQLTGVDGSGITVGVMSDSYDTSSSPIKAAHDVASGDLPGPGNPFGNTEPVVVLQDFPGGTDEGRGMAQIVHDLAPKARLGFATANTGEVGFANNIRALAGFPGVPNTVPGFKADVIVDDIIYLAEPFFQDGIIAQAVDEVAAAGVSYFSSAGNRPATQAYDSPVRIVSGNGDPASLSKTPLNFAAVPPELYAGGFHDFDPSDGVDIAQTIQISPRGTIVFQWNEPFDPQPPIPIATLAEGAGSVPAADFDLFTFDGTAGKLVEIFTDANPSSSTPISDSLFYVFAPDGSFVAFQDTGTNPESLVLTLPQSGTYEVYVGDYNSRPGDYIYRVQEIEVVEQVLSDYNLLFFLQNGTYIGAFAEDNRFTNRPLELGGWNAGGTVNLQMVVARANVPQGAKKNIADRIRYVWFTSGTPQEYFSYLGPVTYGHNSAEGAMGVAAYAFYAPFIPEAFTSPGPVTIYFEKDNKRLEIPRVREKPDLAAMDGANTTFFGGDSAVDADSFPNFFGTSAAAPHAAAIAALVLDAAGGPGTVKPDKMRRILQRSAFPHDLDPYFASGMAQSGPNSVMLSASADANAISQFDPTVISIWNPGKAPLAALSINGDGGNVTQTPIGVVFDERVGPGQPFVVGATVGLDPTDVKATFSLPTSAGQWRQLNLSFAPGAFGRGDLLAFGVDRDEADAAGPSTAVGGNSADLLGDGVLIPQGTVIQGGATFFGAFGNGSAFSGRFSNQIGSGYSPLDGYGFINAEKAVDQIRFEQRNKK